MSSAPITSTSAVPSIFEQYNSVLVGQIVAQLRPILESYAHPAVGIQQRLFDIEQAAIYLGRTPKAVRLLISRSKLPVTKAFDGKIQIDRIALEKLIADGTFYES